MKITIEELAKRNANHFKKVAEQNTAIAKSHTDLAAQTKSKADTLDDSHENKALLTKTVEFHTNAAASHTAIAADATENAKACEADVPAVAAVVEKAAAAAVGAEIPVHNGVDDMLNKTVNNLVEKAFAAMSEDPTVAKRIEDFLLEKVNAALGNKMVPTDVRAALPDSQLVPRPGQAALPIAANDVPPEFAFLGE